MSSRHAKDVTFSSEQQACQTMVLDLEPASAKKAAPPSGEEPTMVLDLSATQVRELLEDTDAVAKEQGRAPAARP
jgi:hypothetical protein